MPLVDLLNALLRAGRNGLPPTPDTLHLGCSYHLHSSHHFLSTWGVVMLEKKKERERAKKKVLSNVEDLTLTVRQRLHTDNIVPLHRLFSTLIVYIVPTSHHAMR